MARDPDHAPFSKYFSPAGWNLIAYVWGRLDDILPTNGSSTRGGSTHISGGRPAAGSQRAYSLGWDRQTDRQTDGSRYRLMPPYGKKGKGSPYSITERRVPELIPVLGSQPAGDVSHKPGGRLPLLYARPAVTPATLTNFAAW